MNINQIYLIIAICSFILFMFSGLVGRVFLCLFFFACFYYFGTSVDLGQIL